MNNVTWSNIPAADIESAAKFYNRVFGWKIVPVQPPDEGTRDAYHTLITGESNENNRPQETGFINGCIVRREIGLPAPTVLITVENLDEKAKEIERAGGKILTEKRPLPTAAGAYIFAADPDGNVIEIWESDDQ